MATLVQTAKNGQSGTQTSDSVTISAPAVGDVLILWMALLGNPASNAPTPTASDNSTGGASWNSGGSVVYSHNRLAMFWKIANTADHNTLTSVVASYTSFNGEQIAEVDEWNTGFVAPVLDAAVDNSGSGTTGTSLVATAAGAGSTAQRTELILGAFAFASNSGSTIASGYTLSASGPSMGTPAWVSNSPSSGFMAVASDANTGAVSTSSEFGLSWATSGINYGWLVRTFYDSQFTETLTASVTSTSVMSRAASLSRSFVASVTSSITQINNIGKKRTANVTSSATVSRTATLARTIAASVVSTSTSTKNIGRTIQAHAFSLASSVALHYFNYQQLCVATVTSSASMARDIAKKVAASVTSTPAAIKNIGRKITASVTSSASESNTVTTPSGIPLVQGSRNYQTGTQSSNSVTIAAPAIGDVLVAWVACTGSPATAATSFSIADNSTGGAAWQLAETWSFNANNRAKAWWKVATLADHNTLTSVTVSYTITNSQPQVLEVDEWETAGTFVAPALDPGFSTFNNWASAVSTETAAIGGGVTSQRTELITGAFVFATTSGNNLSAYTFSTTGSGLLGTPAATTPSGSSLGGQYGVVFSTTNSGVVVGGVDCTWTTATVGGWAVLGFYDSAYTQTITASVVSSVTMVRARLKTITASVTSSSTALKGVGRTITAGVSSTPRVVRQVGRTFTASVTSSSTVTTIRSLSRTIAASVTSSSTVTTIRSRLLALTASVTSSVQVTRSIPKTFVANVTSSSVASAIRAHLVTLTASVTSSAVVTTTRNRLVSLLASVTSSASTARGIGKRIQASATSTPSAVKSVGRTIGASVTSSSTVTAGRARVMALLATVTSSVTVQRAITKTFRATVTTTSSAFKNIAKTLRAVVSSLASYVTHIVSASSVPTITVQTQVRIFTVSAPELTLMQDVTETNPAGVVQRIAETPNWGVDVTEAVSTLPGTPAPANVAATLTDLVTGQPVTLTFAATVSGTDAYVIVQTVPGSVLTVNHTYQLEVTYTAGGVPLANVLQIECVG